MILKNVYIHQYDISKSKGESKRECIHCKNINYVSFSGYHSTPIKVPSFENKLITRKICPTTESKFKSIWTLPGNKHEYVNFIRNFVKFINDDGTTSDEVVNWINEQKDPKRVKQQLSLKRRIGADRVIGGYLKMMEFLGIIKSRKARIIQLDVVGRIFKKDDNITVLLNNLFDKFLYIIEILEILQKSDTSLSTNQIWEELNLRVYHGWKTTHQVTFRLNWLLSFRCIEQVNNSYEITLLGKQVLKPESM